MEAFMQGRKTSNKPKEIIIDNTNAKNLINNGYIKLIPNYGLSYYVFPYPHSKQEDTFSIYCYDYIVSGYIDLGSIFDDIKSCKVEMTINASIRKLVSIGSYYYNSNYNAVLINGFDNTSNRYNINIESYINNTNRHIILTQGIGDYSGASYTHLFITAMELTNIKY